MSLEKIIAGCKKGDYRYQKQLFDRYAGRMKYVCLRYLSDNEDAEDALQEGFINVFSNICKFEGRGHPDAWIRKIFVNTSLNMLRKRTKNQEFLCDVTAHEHHYCSEDADLAEGIDVSEIDMKQIDFGMIEKAEFTENELLSMVSQLEESYKLVFNLYYIDGYRHAEIAALLQIDENTSRSRLSRARKKIQQALYTLSIKRLAV